MSLKTSPGKGVFRRFWKVTRVGAKCISQDRTIPEGQPNDRKTVLLGLSIPNHVKRKGRVGELHYEITTVRSTVVQYNVLKGQDRLSNIQKIYSSNLI